MSDLINGFPLGGAMTGQF